MPVMRFNFPLLLVFRLAFLNFGARDGKQPFWREQRIFQKEFWSERDGSVFSWNLFGLLSHKYFEVVRGQIGFDNVVSLNANRIEGSYDGIRM